MVSWLLQLVYYSFWLLILLVCFPNRTVPCQLQSIDFGNNKLSNEHDKVYESLACLPLAYPTITSIGLGGALLCCIHAFMLTLFLMHVCTCCCYITCCRQQDCVWLGGEPVQCEQGPCRSPHPWPLREDFPPVSIMEVPCPLPS